MVCFGRAIDNRHGMQARHAGNACQHVLRSVELPFGVKRDGNQLQEPDLILGPGHCTNAAALAAVAITPVDASKYHVGVSAQVLILVS